LKQDFFRGTGTRKTTVAQIRLKPGKGKYSINGREIKEYLRHQRFVSLALEPLGETKLLGRFDVIAKIHGGGLSGQAGAFRLGLARALVRYDPQLRAGLKKKGFLTRDPRMVERKKYGMVKARKRFQFSKR
jgi:small subunit ribosomal protein S9